jgi:hypothetical protein
MAMATVPASAQQQQKRPDQAARASGSWCATYPDQGINENCSYSSFNQCYQTVLGRGGFCQPNPFPGTSFGSGYTWSGPGR